MDPNNLILTLRSLRMGGMAEALEQQIASPSYLDMSFEDRLSALLENEVSQRKNRKIKRIMTKSNMRHEAAPETIDYGASRGLDKSVISSLLNCHWVESGQHNLILTGLTGTGKTWLACAFGCAAARKQLTVGYHRVGPLLEDLDTARHDGERSKMLGQIRKLDLLILDDLGLDQLTHNNIIDLLNVLDDRVGRRSTIVAAQMPVKDWHQYLGGGAEADAIMDRIVNSSRQIKLTGESLRAKNKPE